MPPQTAEEALSELRQVVYDRAQLVTVRDRAIRQARTQGVALRVIAEAAGLSKDSVVKILRHEILRHGR